jgi:hypothetical protein
MYSLHFHALTEVLSNIKQNKVLSLPTETSEGRITNSIYKEVAHAAALVLLRYHKIVMNPQDWIEAQIKGYSSYIDDIRNRFYGISISSTECAAFLKSLNMMLNQQIVWITDEANLFMGRYLGEYTVPNSKGLINTRNGHSFSSSFQLSVDCL